MSLKRLRQTLRHFLQQDTESIVAHLPEYRASCLLKARQPAGGILRAVWRNGVWLSLPSAGRRRRFFYEKPAREGKSQGQNIKT
ncbi:hypothetical protein N5C09_18230, partial [Enterobacter sp. GD03975]|nr:hypothetical protein [Enterobacter sp. GD03975]